MALPIQPAVHTIAETIQLSVSPIFMLTAIGTLLNVLAGRLSRVIDRARALEDLHPRSAGPEHDRHVWELKLLDRRMTVVNAGLFLGVTSAIMTCVVVAMLFVATLVKLRIGVAVAVSFILAMILLILALISFMIEVRMSLRANHVRAELMIEQEEKARR
jgi:ABC-type transport system involved in cytochrome bd biosynthesis fused ATPase/permease subunit